MIGDLDTGFVERTVQRFDLSQRCLCQALPLCHIECDEQVDVDGVGEDREEPVVCVIAAQLLGRGPDDAEFGEGLFDPPFPILELIVTGAQVQFHLWPDVKADRLGLFDAGLA